MAHSKLLELGHKDPVYLRARRKQNLRAFDIYKSNVEYGIEYETAEEHDEIIAWYRGNLDLVQADIERVPERIAKYIKRKNQ